MKQPIVPAITAILTDTRGSDMIPSRNAAIPIIPAPTIPAAVPSMETAPLVPAGTFLKLLIKRGSCSIPISLANVSAVAVAIAPTNPPTRPVAIVPIQFTATGL